MMAVEDLDATQSEPIAAGQPNARNLEWLRGPLLVAAIVVSELPLLITFFRRLWANEYYRIFPLVLIASACMLYARWPTTLVPLRRRHRLLGICSLALGFAALVLGVALWSPWIAALGSLFTTLFLLIYFAQGEALKQLGSAWLLLWLLLPIPAQLDRELVVAMQSAAGSSASLWLDALNYNHVLSGQVIHVPGERFIVEDACSPWHSHYVLLCLAAIYVAMLRYPRIPSLLLLLSTFGWAIVANTASIVLTVAFHASGTDLTAGTPRTILALGVLFATLLLLWSTDRFLLCMFAPIPSESPRRDEPKPAEVAPAGRPLVGTLVASAVILGFVLVGAAQAMPDVREETVLGNDPAPEEKQHLAVVENALMPLPGRWSVIRFERFETDSPDTATQHDSAVWKVQLGSTVATVSLSYPYAGWTEVARSSAEQGWDIANLRELRESTDDPSSIPARFVQLENPTGDFAYMALGLFDSSGKRVAVPIEAGWSWDGLKSAIASRFTRRGAEVGANQSLYECRVFVSSKSPFAPDDREKIEELYFAVEQKLAAAVAERQGARSKGQGVP